MYVCMMFTPCNVYERYDDDDDLYTVHTEIIEQCMYVAGGGNGTSEQKQCQGHPSEDPGLNNQAFQYILINPYLLLF